VSRPRRRDWNLIEDHDPNVYFNPAVAGDLALSPSRPGSGPDGPIGVNYILGNLAGRQRCT